MSKILHDNDNDNNNNDAKAITIPQLFSQKKRGESPNIAVRLFNIE